MSFFSHAIAFVAGGVFSLLGLTGFFYLFLLQKIKRNESKISGKSLEKSIPEKTVSSEGVSQPIIIANDETKETKEDSTNNNEKQSKLIKKTEKETKKMDPIHLAVKKTKRKQSKKDGSLPNEPLKEEPPISEGAIKMGWLKIRSAYVWWNRWVILKSGRLIYFRNEKREDCYGIVMLAGCRIEQKESSKKGFCFRIYNEKNIYSKVGLKGEALTSAKMPGNFEQCLIRAPNEIIGKEWIEAIEREALEATKKLEKETNISVNPSEDNTEVITSESNRTSIDNEEFFDTIDVDEETINRITRVFTPPPEFENDLMEFEHAQVKKGHRRSASTSDVDKTPNFTENPFQTKNNLDFLGVQKPEPTFPAPNPSKYEDTSSKNEKENRPSLEIKITPPKIENKGSETKVSPSVVSPIVRDFKPPEIKNETKTDGKSEIKLEDKPLKIEKDSKPKLEREASESDSSKKKDPRDSESSESEDQVDPEENYVKEGWLEIRTQKAWKFYWFIYNNGLLTYYENEKSSDCDGIIDLEGCKIAVRDDPPFKTLEIWHQIEKKPILLVVKQTPEDKKETDIDMTYIKLRSANHAEIQQWIEVIEMLKKRDDEVPVMLPRVTKAEGREEKCHWFNVFMNRYFQDIEKNEALLWMFQRTLQRLFDRIKRPDYLGEFTIEAISFGKEMIQVKELFILPTDNTGKELVGEAEIYYKGGAGLTISTEFYVNFPTFHFATVPVIASVTVKSLSGRMHIYIPPKSRFSLSFIESPNIEFDVNLKAGSKHQYDVGRISKVTEFLVSFLKKLLWKHTVMPNRIFLSLPLPGKKLQPQTKQMTSRTKNQGHAREESIPIPTPIEKDKKTDLP